MKKAIPLMLGLALAIGTTAAVFAQDTATTKKVKKNKKNDTTKKETPKKDGSSSH
jgi:hypothetical protein